MNTGIKTFCTEYKRKQVLDKDIKENKLDGIDALYDSRDRIKYYLNCYITSPISLIDINNKGNNLIELDKEDLEYLYNKYSSRLNEEMGANIKSIKDEYSRV